MNLKIALVGAAVLFGTSALAGEPINITCPAGAHQGLLGNGDVACLKADGSRAGGPIVLLYPSGKVMAKGQVEEKGSMRTGKWVLFDETGAKTHEIDFQKGNFHGKHVEFYPTGKIKKVVTYNAGTQVGDAISYDLTGKVVTTTAAK